MTGDEPLLGQGLSLILLRSGGIESHYVESLDRARRLLATDGPRALVWAAESFDDDTALALSDVRRAHREAGVCLFVRRGDPEALERLLAEYPDRIAFVLRGEQLDARDFVTVVHSTLRGRTTIDASLLERLASRGRDPDRLQLTEGEREVMELVAAGLRNAEIGRRLWKSEKAVEKHVGRLFAKLGLPPGATSHLDRRVAATRIYLAQKRNRDRGLVECDYEPPSMAPDPARGGCRSSWPRSARR